MYSILYRTEYVSNGIAIGRVQNRIGVTVMLGT